MTTPVPARPADRYGRRRPRRSGLISLAVAVVLLAAVAVLWQASPWSGSRPAAGIVGWGPTEDGVIEVVVDVRRPASGEGVSCEVRAIDRRRAVVGTADAVIPPGDESSARVTVAVPVEVEAITAELGACTTR